MSVRLVGCVCAAVLPLLSFPASERVESLIAKMTFEEKVGQLCQYNTKQHGFFFASSDATQASLPEEFLAKIRRGEVGGLISAPGLENYNVLQRAAMESRLKIPLIVGHDVIHGVEVYYPAPFPETCSWDSDLMRRTAERTAPRALRKGVNWTFAPMIDISRDSRWGRIVEGIGEDPFIGALAAAARVKGFQGERLSDGLHIAACAKHYVGYGAVQGGLDYDAVEMSDSTLRNVYLVPFRAAVDAGVATVMSGYHIYNGVHCSANRYLLTDVLRRDLGFGGFVISDYWSVGNLYDCGFAREGDDECAAMTAIRSGIDMEMTGFCYPKGIGKALASGKLKMEEVDEAVRRILVTKERLGLFERPYLDRARLDAAIDDASDLELAREAAEKSVVLLKNRKGTLPLDKGRKIVLIGDIADMPAEMGSSWINLAGSVKGIASLKEGLAKVGQSFEYERCYALTGAVDVAAVERAIARADVVVATFGAYRDESGENRSRADISLSAGQREVIRAIEKSGKTFVAVVFNGRPMVLSELASAADALVEGWQLGSSAGWGVARVLTGEAEPYGRLTATFPNASGECPTYYGRVIGGKSWIPGGDRRNGRGGRLRDPRFPSSWPLLDGFGLPLGRPPDEEYASHPFPSVQTEFHFVAFPAASAARPLPAVREALEKCLHPSGPLGLEQMSDASRSGLAHDGVVAMSHVAAQERRPQPLRQRVDQRPETRHAAAAGVLLAGRNVYAERNACTANEVGVAVVARPPRLDGVVSDLRPLLMPAGRLGRIVDVKDIAIGERGDEHLPPSRASRASCRVSSRRLRGKPCARCPRRRFRRGRAASSRPRRSGWR